jgi:hypothetical protein
MNTFSKKTIAVGIATAATAAAIVAGIASPAMASTGSVSPLGGGSDKTTSSNTSTVTQAQLDALRDVTTGVTGNSAWAPVTVSPSVNLGNVASGNAVGSGNDVPLLSGNTTSIANNDGNGNSITSSVDNLVNQALSGNTASGTSTSTNSGSSSNSSAQSILNGLGLNALLGGDR